jgi:ATP-dependent DNA helicase RecG
VRDTPTAAALVLADVGVPDWQLRHLTLTPPPRATLADQRGNQKCNQMQLDPVTFRSARAQRRSGWIILGLDELAGFAPVQLSGVAALKQGLAGKARACTPPAQLAFTDAELAGKPIIIAKVAATAPSARPCRETSTGQAWIRAWDGDVVMSALEEQALLAQRTHPDFDEQRAPNAERDDLDPQLLQLWTDTAATLDASGLGRFQGEELLRRAGIITNAGVPTLAGLLALGTHPQQRVARYVINLSVERGDAPVRAAEVTTLTGPIPRMLEAALEWARKTFRRVTVAGDDGAVRDQWEYPLEAFRELVANALVHRDLDEWSRGEAVEVRLTDSTLRITNPGGLYGITVDRLGTRGTTSARNARLLEICRYSRSSDGARVVETLATGIPRVVELLRSNGQSDPEFYDNTLRFTVILRSRPSDDPANILKALTDTQRAVYAALVEGELTATQLAGRTARQEPTVRKALRALAARGLTEQRGGRGKTTVYFRKDEG